MHQPFGLKADLASNGLRKGDGRSRCCGHAVRYSDGSPIHIVKDVQA